MGNYWEKRFLQDKAKAVNASEKYLAGEQKKYFTKAGKEITEQIEQLYKSFADGEHITLAEAKRQIRRADFKKVNFEQLAEYQIERNREFKKKKDSLPGDVAAAIEKQHARYESGLRALTKKGQLTYLSLLQGNINKALIDLYDKNQMSIYDFLADEYESAYYRSVFNCQKAIGFGKDFAALNSRAVEKAILTGYRRKNYSALLYAHCENFSRDLKEGLVVGLIKGENIDRMTERISRRLDVASSSARRLVRTETAYIYERATIESYQECGIKQYEYMATLDYRTSPVCQELDGKVFDVKDAMPGKNCPPMHPNCRSTTVCHFENDRVTARIAKDKSGKYYEVPSNMTYKEWEKVSSGLGKGAEFSIKPYEEGKNITSERIAIYRAVGIMPLKVKEALGSTRCIVGKYSSCRYDYGNDIMYIAEGAREQEVIHEIGHAVDNKLADAEKVNILKKKMLQDTGPSDIIQDTFYDTKGNAVKILRVKNGHLVSEYQGRIYADSQEAAFGEDGKLNDGLLYEFVSEAFLEYIEAPENLKKNFPEFYGLVKEMVE